MPETANAQLDTRNFIVTDEYEGERLDKFLSELIPDRSRSYLQGLFKEDGLILYNGKSAKPSTKVKEDDTISVTIPGNVIPDIVPENIPLDILYEDSDVLVVNKPKNMVVHPAPGHYTGTLVNAVMYHCGDSLSGINGVLRPGIVHRIDMNTTGSVIICKNDAAHASIAAQLKEHSITRKYVAICYGEIADDDQTVDANLGRDPKDRKKMAVVGIPNGDPIHDAQLPGKRAVTHIHVLKRYQGYTLVECQLETGRTHQIRVHMAKIGHPLLGDDVYATGRKSPWKTEGQCLHAKVLGFMHPTTHEYVETIAPLPDYFERLLRILPE